MIGRLRFALALSALVAACSGASGTGLFGGAAPGSDSGVQGSGGDGAVASDDSGIHNDNDGGSEKDGGVVGVDGGHKEDAGPHDKPFACGTNDAGAAQSCTGTLCCAHQLYDPFGLTPTSYACVASASTCQATADAIVRCHNGDDCPGQYCCGNFDGTEYTSVGCASSCNHTDAGDDHIRFCVPTRGGVECNQGETCGESGVLSGFYRCAQ